MVPTWDYMLAHVYGELVIHDDVDWLRQAVSDLTDSFEAGRAKPWKLEDAPDDYVAGQLRADSRMDAATEVEGLRPADKK